MTPQQMILEGWKAFDFSSGQYEDWRNQAISWIEQNYEDYPLQVVGFTYNAWQASLGLAQFWACSPATYETLQSNVVTAAQPPLLSLGEVASQLSAADPSDSSDDPAADGKTSWGLGSLFPKGLPWWVYVVIVVVLLRFLRK